MASLGLKGLMTLDVESRKTCSYLTLSKSSNPLRTCLTPGDKLLNKIEPFLPLHASTWGGGVVSLHNLSYSDTPLPVISPSDRLRLFLSQTFTCINSLAFSSLFFFLFAPPMKVEQTLPKCRQYNSVAGNHPKERIQYN
jgi:hypothetical protein